MPQPPSRRSRATRCLLGASALAAGAALAAPTAALSQATLAVQNDRLSSSPLEALPGEIERVDETNAKAARLDILWLLAAPTEPENPRDPADPAYEFERIDAIIRGLGDIDVVPIVTVYSAPPWAARGIPVPEGTEVNPTAPNPRDFANFMAALAERYDGTYTPEGADEPLPEVRHLEIWNEPNLGAFFSPQVQNGRRVAPARYAALLRAAYPVIKRANRNAVVIGGVGGPRSSSGSTGTGARAWLRAVLRSGAPFDAYSQHVYPAAPPLRDTPAFPAWSTVPEILDEIDRVPRHRGKSLYITEAGYTTARTRFRNVRINPAAQARNLRQIMGLPIIRQSDRVPVVVWFNLRDNTNWPGGLLFENFREKPSHAVFQRIARRTPLHPELNPFSLTRRQLLINQRISQAAVRRANAIEEKLNDGLTGEDIRAGALDAGVFTSGVQVTGTAGDTEPPALAPRRKLTIPGRSGGGSARDVRLAAGQLLINQRISQAAVRRTNGLIARMGGDLTGGDLAEGSIGTRVLAPGLSIAGATGSGPDASVTRIADRMGEGGNVRLTVGQLRINQRISQAAVRRSNDLIEVLESGLTDRNFAPRSIGAESLDPGLR